MRIDAGWVRRVRFCWTAGFTMFFFLNLDQFGYSSGLGPAPKYWSVGVFLTTLVLFLPGLNPGELVRSPVAWWALGYLLLSALWIGVADNPESALDGLTMVITTFLYVGTALLAYPRTRQSSRGWAAMLWLALVLAVVSIVQEYFNPAAYVFAEAGQGIPGRAAGLFLNPNSAAQALVMLLACLMLHGSRWSNQIALLIALIGLFFTFSRGGLLAWAVLLIAATIRGRVPRWFVPAVGVGVLLLGSGWLLDALSGWVAPENQNSLDRLAWLLGQGSLSDHSADEREFITAYGWQRFLEAPFLGHGLGHMWSWTAGVGTHNVILRHLVEYGIVGILIFPSLLASSIRSAAVAADHRWLWLFATLVLLLSFFSHNMLEQAHFLFPWLSVCLMPAMKDVQPSQSGRSR